MRRGNRPRCSLLVLCELLLVRHRQGVSALKATGSKHASSTLGGHASHEAESALARDPLWLIGALGGHAKTPRSILDQCETTLPEQRQRNAPDQVWRVNTCSNVGEINNPERQYDDSVLGTGHARRRNRDQDCESHTKPAAQRRLPNSHSATVHMRQGSIAIPVSVRQLQGVLCR